MTTTTTGSTTPWHIIEMNLFHTGAMVAGISRRARAARCRHCQAPIIQGYDADTAALVASVDPTALTPLGEALAHLENRQTYSLQTEGGRLVLNHRTAGRITHRPAGTGRFDVMPEHHCHAPARLPATTSVLVTAHAAVTPPPGSPPPY